MSYAEEVVIKSLPERTQDRDRDTWVNNVIR